MKKNKLLLFFSTGISLLGVLVASIATMAWFGISFSQPGNLTDPTEFVTGSSEIEVGGVGGYKYMWDENTDGTEAETGTVISAKAEGEKGLANNYGNTDEDDVAPIDHADLGVGYYILGDSSWAAYAGSVFSRCGDAWKYSSSLKMDERYSHNYAAALSIELAAGEQIQIKRHTYVSSGGATTTSDSPLTALGTGSDTYASIDREDGVITIREGQAGTYDLYVNTYEEVCLNQKNSNTPSLSAFAPLGSPITKRALDNASKGFIRLYVEDQKGPWSENQYFSRNDDGSAADYFYLKITAATFVDESGYESISDFPFSDSIFTFESGHGQRIFYSSEDSAILAYPSEGGYELNVYKWFIDLPWVFESISFKFVTSITGRAITNNPTYTASFVSEKQNTFYLYHDTWNEEEQTAYFGVSHDTVTSYSTSVSVPRYTAYYYKNNSDTLLGTDTVVQNTYYAPKDSFKSGDGAIPEAWRGWYTSDDFSIPWGKRIMTDDVDIFGQYTDTYYFRLYLIKVDHEGNKASAIPFGSTQPSYSDGCFNPVLLFDENECAVSYPGYSLTPYGESKDTNWYTGYNDSTHVLSTVYNSEFFDDFSTDSENPVALYRYIYEKTITLTRKWVKLRYSGFTDDLDELVIDVIDSFGTDQTAYGDTTIAPAVPDTYYGSPNLTGYRIKQADTYWQNVGSVGSSNLGNDYTAGQIYTSAATIYFLYLPDDAYVTYEYRLFYIDSITKEETEYSKPSYRPDAVTFKRHYNDSAFVLSNHSPTTSWHVGDSETNTAYYFGWDELFYTDSSCQTTYDSPNVDAGVEQTLYIKLKATVETMYFDAKANIDEWSADLDTTYVHLYQDVDVGVTGDLPCRKLDDGIHRFYMTTGVNFMMYNGGGSSNNTRYTTNINLGENDSGGHGRGHCNCIRNSNELGLESHVKWYWSNYFGSEATGGDIDRGAKACFSDPDKNVDFFHGDGVFNMYVYDNGLDLSNGDTFAVRFNNHGVYYWYDYDDLDADSRKYVYNTSEEEYDSESIGGVAWSTSVGTGDAAGRHALKIKYSGSYNIYFTAQGKVSIASVPSAKGEGYYIMPYDPNGVYGNNLKSSFNNALKFRTVELADGRDGNVAIYKNLTVTSDCRSFYIKSYVDGVDHGPMEAFGSNQYATMGTEDDAGIFTFHEPGAYNIYLQRSNSSSTPYYTIYITQTKTGEFFSMNDITTEHDLNEDSIATIYEQKTTMVVEVKFRSTANSGSINIGADIMRTGAVGSPKISKYLKYGVMYSDTDLGKASFERVRDHAVYSTMQTFANDSAMKLSVMTDTIVSDSGWKYLYVFVDYAVDKATLENNRANLANDFKILLKARG